MFGKHRGSSLEVLLLDTDYVDWLMKETDMPASITKPAAHLTALAKFVKRFLVPRIKNLPIAPKAKRLKTVCEIHIGSNTFTSIPEAREYLQNIFEQAGPTESLQQLNAVLYNEMMSLLQQHPEANLKRVHEAIDIKIFKGYKENLYHLKLKFPDGSEDSISYLACLTQRVTNTSVLQDALRNAIAYQISRFKHNTPNKQCEQCKTTIASEYHVDHVQLFSDLSSRFLATKLQTPQSFDKVPDVLGILRPQFKAEDNDFQQEWQQYHLQHASLRWLCAKCNLTRSKKI